MSIQIWNALLMSLWPLDYFLFRRNINKSFELKILVSPTYLTSTVLKNTCFSVCLMVNLTLLLAQKWLMFSKASSQSLARCGWVRPLKIQGWRSMKRRVFCPLSSIGKKILCHAVCIGHAQTYNIYVLIIIPQK